MTGQGRLEALTGHGTLRHQDTERRLLDELAAQLGARPAQALDTLRKCLTALADSQTELTRLRTADLRTQAKALADTARPIGSGRLLIQKVADVSADKLRQLASQVLNHLSLRPAVVVLVLEHDVKALLTAAITTNRLDHGPAA